MYHVILTPYFSFKGHREKELKKNGKWYNSAFNHTSRKPQVRVLDNRWKKKKKRFHCGWIYQLLILVVCISIPPRIRNCGILVKPHRMPANERIGTRCPAISTRFTESELARLAAHSNVYLIVVDFVGMNVSISEAYWDLYI